MAAAWRDVLHLERVGIHANFFSVGGTSLLAGMIAFQVGAAFGVDASVALLLRHPTIAELAAKVSSKANEGQERKGIPGAAFSPEQKAEGVPLSFYQEQMVTLGMQGFQAYDQLFAYQVSSILVFCNLCHATPMGMQMSLLAGTMHIKMYSPCVKDQWDLEGSAIAVSKETPAEVACCSLL